MNCKSCSTRQTAPGRTYCDTCLNDWLTMRALIQGRLEAQHGPTTRENYNIMLQDMQAREAAWKRDRLIFDKQESNFYPS